MVTEVIGDWTEEMALKAVITDPTFIGEIGIGAVNISETELGLLEGSSGASGKLIIGGIMIQWGAITALSGGEREITFETAFGGTPVVSVNVKNASPSSTNTYSWHPSTVSTTAFTVQGRRLLDTGVGITDILDDDTQLGSYIAIGLAP